MTPATIVRRRGGPFTFIGFSAMVLEREEARPKSKPLPKCVARQDDGSPCNLPARYLDFKLGGHVCFEHKPDRKKEVLQLV